MKKQTVPARMCLSCREMKDKNLLVRIVRAKDGTISVDETGKAAGRGAYICKTEACVRLAIKQKALNRAFKTNVAADIYEALGLVIETDER